MKVKEERNKKPAELSEEELAQVAGGLDFTAEILRTIKGKVVNAANDTNTDVDRSAIQKELDASVQQIEDKALLTFKGIPLNNGNRS